MVFFVFKYVDGLASNGDRLYEQLEMLEMSELLWSLCEILLIDTVPGLFSLL